SPLSPLSLHDALPIYINNITLAAHRAMAWATPAVDTAACRHLGITRPGDPHREVQHAHRDASLRSTSIPPATARRSEPLAVTRRSEEHTSELQSRENL